MENKREAYHRQVAEKLIKQLEQGTAPWQRPWQDSEVMPFNAATGKAYKGVNILQLMSEGYSDPRWMTYIQAKSIGAQVKAGEKGTVIHYTKYEEQRVKRDNDGKPVLDEQGKTVKETVKLVRPKNFQAHVFNIEQIDNHNLPPLPPKSQQAHWNPIERAEQILAASGANISHQPGNRAFYRAATDSITLPEKSQFPSAESYYDTALHELGHWTGHESRLNRDMKSGFGSQGYAKEELRAEIASMMLASEVGIAHDTEQNAAYVKSWIKVLKDDPQEIYRAAKDAEQIQRFVLGLEHKQTLAQEQAQEQQEQQTASTAQSAKPEHERHYLKTEFKDREEVKKRGAKWDAEEKLWYVPKGIDKAAFAQWPQTTPEQTKAERAQNAQQASQTQTPQTKTPQVEAAKRHYLAVPIERKDEAKAAGARWDKAARAWYAGPQADWEKLDKFRAQNIAIQQELPIRPQEEFTAAMRSIGLIVDGEHPIMDGKSHRVAVEGGKKGAKDGFYVGHLDGRPAGCISNNRTGAKITWKSNATVLTDAQRAKLAAEAAENRAKREIEQKQLQEQAALRVAKQLQSLKPITAPTPYLQSKGIGIYQGVKTSQDGKATIIPAFDADGKHWTTQYIQENGDKRFAKDGRKKGCFHPVGSMDALKAAPVLVIAEGYATAASLAEALGHATVAAFDSGNLKDVALALHEKYPNKPIVIAGDDDQKQESQNGRNPGREKATLAAKAVDGAAIFPIFAPGEQQAKGLSDFNDLASKSELGMDGLKRQVSAAISQETQRHQQRRQQQQVLAAKQEQGMKM